MKVYFKLGSIHNLPRGWAMMSLSLGEEGGGGVSLFFPTMIYRGLWKISNENDIEHRRGQSYKNDSRLFDAFQELKDDLQDDTAWPVAMQWFF